MLLEAKGLSKSFGGIHAVSAVDLYVPEKSIIAVIGPNGAGKTTFFNMVTGVYSPDAGSLVLDGESLLNTSADQIALKGIARTFQTIRIFRGMTVLENVLVSQAMRVPHGLSAIFRTAAYCRKEQAAINFAFECLERVGLGGVSQEIASCLSYGQQRCLEIARALALKPRVLLLDEPAAGMNAQEKAVVIHLVKVLKEELGISIVLIEHDMEMVAKLADRVTVLHHGQVLAEGEPAEISRHPDVIAAYLG
ncbi:MAG: ABC transporter ATP-binding protein [Pseudomonadota bacterium]